MKNRFTFPLLTILLISLLFLPNAFSEDTVVRVAPHALLDDNLYEVDIVIENGQNVAGYQVMLQYNSNELVYMDFKHGDYLPMDAYFGEPKDIDRTKSLKAVLFAATSLNSESNGYGLLATLTFEIKDSSNVQLILLAPQGMSTPGTVVTNKAGKPMDLLLEHSEKLPQTVRDLVIESVKAVPKGATEERNYYNKGEEFELRATVRNKGNVLIKAKELKIYGYTSTPKDINSQTNLLETVDLDSLDILISPKHTIEISVPDATVTAPDTLGTYFYSVYVGILTDKDEHNNFSAPIKITIDPPDLKVTQLRVKDSIEKLKTIKVVGPGKEFDLTVMVTNLGSPSDEKETTLWWYYDGLRGAIISPEDKNANSPKVVGATRIKPVPKRNDAIPVRRITITAPTKPGTHIYRVSIASVNGEVKLINNASTAVIKVGRPTLTVQAKLTTVAHEHVITLSSNFQNLDPSAQNKPQINYYISSNDIISLDDMSIALGSDVGEPVEIPAPKIPGTYYYGACVVSDLNDGNTENICSEAVEVTVSGISLKLPDKLITDVAFGPNSTYFIFNPQVPEITGELDSITIHVECLIKIDIPVAPAEPPSWFAPADTPRDYLMFPLENVNWGDPQGLEIKDVVDTGLNLTGQVLDKTKDYQQSTKVKKVTKVFPKVVQGLGLITEAWSIFSEANEARKAVADPVMEIKEDEHYYSFLFMIPRRISFVGIEMNRYYHNKDEEGGWNILPLVDPHTYTVEYEGRWNLEETFYEENPDLAAAPSAQPMSLADYAPFQQLPPEVQEYLLQHFEGPTNIKAINPEVRQIPEKTSLLANYPNPFNPETWIPYQLAEPADVTLTIYDIKGHVVRTLDLGHQRSGTYRSRARAAHWDGRNAHGELVASGLYFYTLKAGYFTSTRKMLVRK